MSEYTSLEVSKRLAEAGFTAETDMQRQDITIGDKIEGLPHVREFVLQGAPAYRYDTLLDWLMHKPLFSLRTHTVDVQARGVQMVGKKEYELRLFVAAILGNGEMLEANAPTLSDALAEVVMKVMDLMDVKL